MKPYLLQFEDRLLSYYTCLDRGQAPEQEEYECALEDIRNLIAIVNEFEKQDDRRIKEISDQRRRVMARPLKDYDAHQ